MKKILLLIILLVFPSLSLAQENFDQFSTGKVIEILEEGTFEGDFEFQRLKVESEGEILNVTHSMGPFLIQSFQKVDVGDKVILMKDIIDGQVSYSIRDQYRLPAIGWFFALFALIVFAVGKWKGLRSFVGLILSVLILTSLVVPMILDGYSPISSSMLGAILITFLSIYVSHGFNKRTSVAVGSTLITLFVSFMISYFFLELSRLTGFGTEEAFFLQFGEASVDLKGLLLGGIMIGALGVLDDITTAQAAVVDEIYGANPKQSVKEVFTRAMSVGNEHIASLVNTLVLAYAGASFPLLLLFYLNNTEPLWLILNSEFMAEEIVRTLSGSLALILAVPITTYMACHFLKGGTGIKGGHCHHH